MIRCCVDWFTIYIQDFINFLNSGYGWQSKKYIYELIYDMAMDVSIF
jgi:hypothetical protein